MTLSKLGQKLFVMLGMMQVPSKRQRKKKRWRPSSQYSIWKMFKSPGHRSVRSFRLVDQTVGYVVIMHFKASVDLSYVFIYCMSLFSGKKYTVYNVEGRDSSGNHNEVQKRYNEFLDLRRRLIEIQPAIAEIPFPKKTLFASKDSDARKDRRRILFGAFLQRALDKCRAETERWLGDACHVGANVFIGSSALRRALIDRLSEFVAHIDFRRIFELTKIPTPMLKFSAEGTTLEILCSIR